MSSRKRVNPFDTGTAERVLYDRWRKARMAAEAAARTEAMAATEREAYSAAAEKYADALRALGHGDKVPGQIALLPPAT